MARCYIEYLGSSIELPVGETIVGRDVGCALRFNDPAVSRRHLRFVRRNEDLVFVEDLGSTNGTLLNGRSVAAPIRIRMGDLITVGGRELTVHIAIEAGDAQPTEPSTLNLGTAAPVRNLAKMGSATTRIAVTVPPPARANQRCPSCGAAVSSDEPECAACNHRWDSFRPATPTAVGANPLARRRHERHSIELPIVYVSSELEIEATTRNLSESGVFVCSQVLDPIGTHCQLTILVDGGPALHVRAIVRRVVEHDEGGDEPVGLGVEFVEVGEVERTWLEATVARMTADADA